MEEGSRLDSELVLITPAAHIPPSLDVCPLVPPLNSAKQLVMAIARISGESPERVRDRLVEEERAIGSTVAKDAMQRDVPPNDWSPQMADFYAESDAYLYDSTVWNRTHAKVAMRKWIGKYISFFATRPQRIEECRPARRRVLVHGDGLGYDSLYLALLGHDVTYFEVAPKAIRFARSIFDDADAQVTIVEDEADVAAESFDVVVSLDVLEHVPQPENLLRNFVTYLRPDGRLLVSAPFYAVCPQRFPTHLRSNLKYAGDWRFFESFGLQLVDGSTTWDPLVFRKTEADTFPDGSRALRRWKLRVAGRLFALARKFPQLFIRIVNGMLRRDQSRINELRALNFQQTTF